MGMPWAWGGPTLATAGRKSRWRWTLSWQAPWHVFSLFLCWETLLSVPSGVQGAGPSWAPPGNPPQRHWKVLGDALLCPSPGMLLLQALLPRSHSSTMLGSVTAKSNLDKLKGEGVFKQHNYTNIAKWALMLWFCDLQNELKLLLHPAMEWGLISYNSLSPVSLNIVIVNSMNRAFVWWRDSQLVRSIC